MLEEARSTGNSTSIIDFHPKSTMLQKLFYQTPNVPKSEILWKLNEWSLQEKRMNTMKNNHNISVLSSGTNFDNQNLIQDPPQVKTGQLQQSVSNSASYYESSAAPLSQSPTITSGIFQQQMNCDDQDEHETQHTIEMTVRSKESYEEMESILDFEPHEATLRGIAITSKSTDLHEEMREGLEDVLMISKCSESHGQMEASLESITMTSNLTEPHEDMEESWDYHN